MDYPKCHESIGYSIFQTSEDDEKPGLSVEDREFLKIMDNNIYRDESGQWVAPLPFREPRPRLGNNRQSALRELPSYIIACREFLRNVNTRPPFQKTRSDKNGV